MIKILQFLKKNLLILVVTGSINWLHATCNVKADFTFTINGFELTLVNNSTNANYYWIDMGNGVSYSIGNWNTVRHVYGSVVPQTYTVTIVAFDTNHSNCTDTSIQTVTTYTLPCFVTTFYWIVDDSSKNFSGLIHTYCYATRPSRTTWTWQFGDGDTSHAVNPTHVYPGPGKYLLCLTLDDSICTSTFCDSIGFDSSGNIKRGVPYSIRVFGGPETNVSEVSRPTIDIHLAPNPGNSIVHLLSEHGVMRQVKIVDIQGRLIYSKYHNTNTMDLDFSMSAPGLYIISVTNEFLYTQTIKFVRSE